jgi:hypothetical protein
MMGILSGLSGGGASGACASLTSGSCSAECQALVTAVPTECDYEGAVVTQEDGMTYSYEL